MLAQVIITSRQSSASFILSDPKPPGRRYPVAEFRATVRERDRQSSAEVYLYQPDGLADFFVDLTRHPNGWLGEKQWVSLEGHLTLSYTWASADWVSMSVCLKPEGQPEMLPVVIAMAAAELGAIASQIRDFLHLEAS